MTKTIIANFKMNLSISKSLQYIKKLKKSKHQVVLAAPFTFLNSLNQANKANKFKLAAQNVAKFAQGAYSGEISAKMLKEVGCLYSLVGHSERRIYFQETDNDVNEKVKQLLSNNIKAVICIGENFDQKSKGLAKQIIKKQLSLGLKNIKQVDQILIAYEPVWAISTFQKGKIKRSAELNDIVEAHDYIKSVLQSLYKTKASKIKVLYGGTVKPENAQQILGLEQVDGALVGGASLNYSRFNAILDSI